MKLETDTFQEISDRVIVHNLRKEKRIVLNDAQIDTIALRRGGVWTKMD